jgi:hypothetical protein
MPPAISLTAQILQQPGINPETIATVALFSAVVPRTAKSGTQQTYRGRSSVQFALLSLLTFSAARKLALRQLIGRAPLTRRRLK